jgi:hypothetical protein
VLISLFVASYGSPTGGLDAWNTFGPAVVLLLVAACAALWLCISTIAERSVAIPVAAAVWGVTLGLAAVVSALVRVFERPDHANALGTGAWLALAGALAILAGAWQSLRDERTACYPPATPEPRPGP